MKFRIARKPAFAILDLANPAMRAANPHQLGNFKIIGDGDAALERGHVMGVIEAERPNASEFAERAPCVGRVERLAAILYEHKVAAIADVDNSIHGAGIAVDRNDHDAASLR